MLNQTATEKQFYYDNTRSAINRMRAQRNRPPLPWLTVSYEPVKKSDNRRKP
jgi:hypothetical protein